MDFFYRFTLTVFMTLIVNATPLFAGPQTLRLDPEFESRECLRPLIAQVIQHARQTAPSPSDIRRIEAHFLHIRNLELFESILSRHEVPPPLRNIALATLSALNQKILSHFPTRYQAWVRSPLLRTDVEGDGVPVASPFVAPLPIWVSTGYISHSPMDVVTTQRFEGFESYPVHFVSLPPWLDPHQGTFPQVDWAVQVYSRLLALQSSSLMDRWIASAKVLKLHQPDWKTRYPLLKPLAPLLEGPTDEVKWSSSLRWAVDTMEALVLGQRINYLLYPSFKKQIKAAESSMALSFVRDMNVQPQGDFVFSKILNLQNPAEFVAESSAFIEQMEKMIFEASLVN